MKPTIIVEGKVYPVREMVFNGNGIESVSILKDDSYLRIYDAKVETTYFVEQPLLLDFDEVLNLNSELEDKLIKHLEGVLNTQNRVLTEMAINAMEESSADDPFAMTLLDRQREYKNEQRKIFGAIDMVEEVKAFLEGYYDKGGDENVTDTIR